MRAFLSLFFGLSFSLLARDIEIRPQGAAKHGITIKLSNLSPGVVQAALDFATLPKNIGLVLRDSQNRFVSSVAVLPRDHSCSAIISEDCLQHSYFVFPYVAGPDEPVYQVFLRDP